MRPDIALASVRGIVVLDSKYRIGSNLNDSLSSIHTYRDALVEMQGSDVQRSVRAAYLLTPAEPALSHTGDWKAASLPGRLFHPVYRTEFRFGALTFRPGMNMKDVTDALELLLKDADR